MSHCETVGWLAGELGKRERREFTARYDYDSIDIHDGSWLSPIENSWAINGPEGKPRNWFFNMSRIRLNIDIYSPPLTHSLGACSEHKVFGGKCISYQLLDFSSASKHCLCKRWTASVGLLWLRIHRRLYRSGKFAPRWQSKRILNRALLYKFPWGGGNSESLLHPPLCCSTKLSGLNWIQRSYLVNKSPEAKIKRLIHFIEVYTIDFLVNSRREFFTQNNRTPSHTRVDGGLRCEEANEHSFQEITKYLFALRCEKIIESENSSHG